MRRVKRKVKKIRHRVTENTEQTDFILNAEGVKLKELCDLRVSVAKVFKNIF